MNLDCVEHSAIPILYR